eukprot:365338-Chlamydomonas_euryale.AAC.23
MCTPCWTRYEGAECGTGRLGLGVEVQIVEWARLQRRLPRQLDRWGGRTHAACRRAEAGTHMQHAGDEGRVSTCSVQATRGRCAHAACRRVGAAAQWQRVGAGVHMQHAGEDGRGLRTQHAGKEGWVRLGG